MTEILEPNAFLDKKKIITAVDVRTPDEFSEGHIPGAVNIPLFSNGERAEIGTLYKQKGKDTAVMKGLEIVGPKLAWFVTEAARYAPEKEILVHCWRGGMRSGSFAWLLDTAGFKVFVLRGGYKNYRSFIRNRFLELEKTVILGGMTGTGKTDILNSLKARGEQVLDLEKYANHKGSAFGFIGQQEQPTNEQFENDTYEPMHDMDLSKPVWIEDESHKIGKVIINDNLYLKMRSAPLIKLSIPDHFRIERLVKDYCFEDSEILINTVLKISRRLGDQNARKVIEKIGENDYNSAVRIILDYYDKGYMFGIGKRNPSQVHELNVDSGDPDICAGKIAEFYSTMEK